MGLDVPAPLANISFPPTGSNLYFNYLDSFWTSWTTPRLSKGPCFLSIFYYNPNNVSAGWKIKFNESVPLNGTKVVALGSLDLRGLGQLNLNYIEPAGSLETALSEIFHVNHDSMQPNPATYNKDAIQETSTSSKATPTSSPLSSNLLATTDRILISSTMIPQPSASSPAPNNKASSSIQGGDIASIILGAILGILVAALIILHRIRRRREQRVSSEASRSVPLSPLATLPDSHLYEKDAVTPPNELPCNHSWAELPAPRR